MREHRNEMRKKIENYSYGLNDHLNFAKRSNIFKGVNQNSLEAVAIKVVDLRNKDIDATLKEQLGVEIEALKKLNHPNIVKCLDIYSTLNNCYIITEFCEGGDINNRITTRGPFKESEALSLFRDLFVGYTHLAQEKFIHGGLKPSSLLLKDNILKITGLGNCRKLNKPEVRREVPFNCYQSPESVREGIFDQKSDIWSIGMILYSMLHGKEPWEIIGPSDLMQGPSKLFPINGDLSEDVRDFLRQTITSREERLTLEKASSHRFILRIMNNSFTAEKYNLGAEGAENKVRKQKQNHNHQITKVEKHIACQINWMRFLFRLMDRFNGVSEESSTVVLKFIILRQISVQYFNIRLHLEEAENPFAFGHWPEFVKEKDKMGKYLQVFKKNQGRYDKAKTQYLKLLEKLYLSHNNFRGLVQILNDNFQLSQYNCIFALGATIQEIKRLWEKITRQFNSQGKYVAEGPFKFKAELLLIDFLMTYYQLNCLLIEDFQRLDYFQKMSKLDLILEYQPAELEASHLQELEGKLKQLGIL